MKKTAVIMAGGKGERFWPQSRTRMPKQFLSLTSDGKTMIQLTVERLLRVVDMEDIFVVTNQAYRDIVARQLPQLPKGNVLCEPMAKNTAPCVAYAAGVIGAKYDDAVMYILASDHIIQNKPLFADTLELAAEMAQRGENIVTIGITPTYAETGYGYIKFLQGEATGLHSVYAVDRFVEKPDADTARRYLEDGCYLWNSGMFVWTVSTLMKNLSAFLPDLAKGAQAIRAVAGTAGQDEAVNEMFASCAGISIDYGIMEKARNIYTIPGSFGWDDVGSWLSLERINPTDARGNVVRGEVVQVDTENNIFVSGGRLIAAVGVQNLVVVDTGDVVLVCDKDNTQDVKKVVEKLRAQGASRYL